MTAQELRSAVLQLALQGKLVTQNPNDEPASIYIDRVLSEKGRLTRDKIIKKDKMHAPISDVELAFEIPDSWVWVRLSSIITLISGQDLEPGQYNDVKMGIPYITGASNFSKGTLLINRWTKTPRAIAVKNDLLLTCKGTVGELSVLLEDEVHIARQVMALRTYCNFSLNYLKYFMQSYVIKLKSKAKSMIPGIERENVLNICIPIPPLKEQDRIVAKVDEVFSEIDKYEMLEKELSSLNRAFPGDLRKSILQFALEGKLVPQNPEDEPASVLVNKIKEEKENLTKEKVIKKEKTLVTQDENPFEIPESWTWVNIGEVCCNIQYGTAEKSSLSGKIVVLRMGNIQNGRLDYSNLVYTSNDKDIEQYKLNPNDILFNRTNSKELVGKTAIYKGEQPAIFAGYLIRFTPLLINSDYVNWVMQSGYYKKYCWRAKSDGVSQSNINAEKLKSFRFPLPPLSEQKRIVARIEELMKIVDILESDIKSAS